MDGICTALVLAAAVVLAVAGLPSTSAASPAARAAAAAYAAVDQCGASDRLCLAYPDGCSANSSCTLIATARVDPSSSDKYLFELSAQFTGYVALALAESSSMGADSVVECVFNPTAQKVQLYQSLNRAYNPQTKKRGNSRLPAASSKGVELINGTLADGVISCSFSRDRVTTVGGKEYDLANGTWVLQAAAGNKINADTSVHHHTEWVVSGEDRIPLSTTGLLTSSHGSRREDKPSSAASLGASAATLALALAALAASFGR